MLCGIVAPAWVLSSDYALQMSHPQTIVEYDIKIYNPRRSEALRQVYCNGHLDFCQSMAESSRWETVTGGKSPSVFHRTFDGKYIIKEVRSHEIKMLMELTTPHYYNYMAKVFFEHYPCLMAKILGVFRIEQTHYRPVSPADGESVNIGVDPELDAHQAFLASKRAQLKVIKKSKKYVIVLENLNFGIDDSHEEDLIRFDLKGSSYNRFL